MSNAARYALELFSQPHYRDPAPAAHLGASPCGWVAVISVGASDLAPAEFPQLVAAVRSLVLDRPRLTVVCSLSGPISVRDELHAFRDLDVHAVVRGSLPALHDLRLVLTETSLVPDWVRMRLEATIDEHRIVDWACDLVSDGLRAPPTGPLPPGHVRGGARWRCPPASHWFRLAQALNGAMALQRAHKTSVSHVAHGLGYHDASSLSRQLNTVFGHRPSFIRPRLGWPWLLDDWWQRQERYWPV